MVLPFGKIKDSKKMFPIHKMNIKLMASVNKSFFCRELFEKCNIFPSVCEYSVSLLSFITENIKTFQKNYKIHSINMRYKHDLHMPNATLISYQKVYLYKNQVTVKCFKCMPKQKRAQGRPKKNWMEGIRKAKNKRNLNEGQREDKKQWSLGVGQRRKAF
jgi:hypothetical protein